MRYFVVTMADDSNPLSERRPIRRRRAAITASGDGWASPILSSAFVFLVVLLVTRWSDWLRDLAYRLGISELHACRSSSILCLLLVISKALGIGLDYYGFRLERGFKLSNQRFGSWVWDEIKGFLVGLVLAAIVVELLYFTIRQWPQHWWLLAWALFMGLFVLLAQLAPVVLFPIFYKFEPLENEDCGGVWSC